jgi:hypothetical protein
MTTRAKPQAEALSLFDLPPAADPRGEAECPRVTAGLRRELLDAVRYQIAVAAVGPLGGVTCFVAAGPFTALGHPLSGRRVAPIGVHTDGPTIDADLVLGAELRLPAGHIDRTLHAARLCDLLAAVESSPGRWTCQLEAKQWRQLRRGGTFTIGAGGDLQADGGPMWSFRPERLPPLDAVKAELIEATPRWAPRPHAYLVVRDTAGRRGLCAAAPHR